MWVVLPNFLVYRKNFVAVQIGSVRGSCAAVRCFDMPRRPPGDLHRPWVWDETDSIGQCQAIIDNESITYALLERAASEIAYYAECRKLFRRALYRYATLTTMARTGLQPRHGIGAPVKDLHSWAREIRAAAGSGPIGSTRS